jgi:hypothetical protein
MQANQSLDDQRKAVREIIPRAAVEPHLCARLARNNPKTIVLDVVQPFTTSGQFMGFAREARRDEPGRQGTLQHGGQITFGQSRLQIHH